MTSALPQNLSGTDFSQATVSFKYLFGEVALAVVPFPVWRNNRSFLDPSLSDLDVNLAFGQMPAKVSALYLPSWPTAESRASLRFSRNAIRYIPFVAPRYYVELKGSFEEYLQERFSAKTRHNLTRSVKKFAELSGGTVDFREYRKPAEMQTFHTTARGVSALTYQDRLLHAGLPDSSAFIEGLVEDAGRDNVRGYILYHENAAVAFAYCQGRGECLYYSVVGYDSAYAKWSPGTILLIMILKEAFAEGKYSIVDFGQGESQYKSMFSTANIVCADTYYFRWGVRNAFYVTLHYVIDRFSYTLGRVLARYGLKQRVRHLLRRWL